MPTKKKKKKEDEAIDELEGLVAGNSTAKALLSLSKLKKASLWQILAVLVSTGILGTGTFKGAYEQGVDWGWWGERIGKAEQLNRVASEKFVGVSPNAAAIVLGCKPNEECPVGADDHRLEVKVFPGNMVMIQLTVKKEVGIYTRRVWLTPIPIDEYLEKNIKTSYYPPFIETAYAEEEKKKPKATCIVDRQERKSTYKDKKAIEVTIIYGDGCTTTHLEDMTSGESIDGTLKKDCSKPAPKQAEKDVVDDVVGILIDVVLFPVELLKPLLPSGEDSPKK
ncbi:hypothetical protein LCGC14_0145200 [marine sediment metagenome]|uniref:Uncharacterized protein n=1 Tax=marine sediment metagenome TaxID=412755 RepID=A0A0F9Y195_9ZZZZ